MSSATRPEPRRDVDDVRAELLAEIEPVTTEAVRVQFAGGRVLAEPVLTPAPLPPESRAAMDGVAVRAGDTRGASAESPVRLRHEGAVLAGQAAGEPVSAGACRTIATGAPLPPGADAVVRLERLIRDEDAVWVQSEVADGTDVRLAGEDAAAGDVLVASGQVVSAAALAGITGAGVEEVIVRRRPRITVLPTGDEIALGTTPDALGASLTRLLEAAGAEVTVAGPVRDDVDALTRALTTAATVSDLVITTGGVSVGPADRALEALTRAGTGRSVALALKPGKPFAWGRIHSAWVCCLPGNPSAAFAATILLVRPLVAALLGGPSARPTLLRAATRMCSPAGVRHLVAATIDGVSAVPVEGHGSGDLRRLARTEVFLDVPPDVTEVAVGDPLSAWPLP